jgi:HSP20 family protein
VLRGGFDRRRAGDGDGDEAVELEVGTVSMMHFEPFRSSMRELDRLSSQLLSGTRVPLAMPMDVWREGQTYHVALDLPGVDAESIDLRVERNTLTVAAQRQALFGREQGGQPEGGEDEQALVAERPQGVFTRQLVLGEGLDTDSVQADYTNGVLHLTIPMAQAAQPRRIQVGSSGQGGQPEVVGGGTEQQRGDQQAQPQ